MPHLEVEMRLLNARHFASATRGVGDLIFSKPTLAVEHEWELLAWELNCVDLYQVGGKTDFSRRRLFNNQIYLRCTWQREAAKVFRA